MGNLEEAQFEAMLRSKFKFSKVGYRRLQNHLSVLDERPIEGWEIYGDDIRYLVQNMWFTLCEVRQNKRKLLGRSGESRATNIYNAPVQQRLRQEKFNASPYCEAPPEIDCPARGQKLDWDVAQIDHIIAVTDGGETTHENTRLLCASCHAVITAESRRERHKHRSIPYYYGWEKEDRATPQQI